MSIVTSFADVHRVVDSWPAGDRRHRYSLDHMFELLEFLGNPHKQLRVVHVAGTSGKTSTAYYVAALLQATGKRVGLTISPHVDEVNERVQINLQPMPEAQFASRLGEFLGLVQKSGVQPNYFELFMTFALWEFAAQRVDYAVVEVGIGGLLDSTNVFDDPEKACVITDIGYDHMRVLGSTLAEITEHKAGIIQLHNAVFCYRQAEEVNAVIARLSAQKLGDLHVMPSVPAEAQFDFLPLFEQRNFGLALAAARLLQERDELPPLAAEDIERAAHTHIPARMEARQLDGKTLILDAAHNGQKMHALIESMQARYGDAPMAALVRLAVREGRSLRMRSNLEELAKGVTHLIFTSLGEMDRAFSPEELRRACQQLGFDSFETIADPAHAFAALRKRPEPVLLVAGSFRLLNHIRPRL